jgi:hypothetical protein
MKARNNELEKELKRLEEIKILPPPPPFLMKSLEETKVAVI